MLAVYLQYTNFNPLSPHGERPLDDLADDLRRFISIHSPRMGRDEGREEKGDSPQNFNPLSPHGERPIMHSAVATHLEFQSTLPAWGETRST